MNKKLAIIAAAAGALAVLGFIGLVSKSAGDAAPETVETGAKAADLDRNASARQLLEGKAGVSRRMASKAEKPSPRLPAPKPAGEPPPSGPPAARGASIAQGSESVTLYGSIGDLGAASAAPATRSRRPAAQPASVPPPRLALATDTEQNVHHGVRRWIDPVQDRFSTFAIDVDTASYSQARRALESGQLPPAASVRVEEFVNYFSYFYPAPEKQPFKVSMEAAPSPFDPRLTLLRIALQGRKANDENRKPAHLTFLVDTSGSMGGPDRIELAKLALRHLTSRMRAGDTVAIATYSGSSRVVLKPTSIKRRNRIVDAIDSLRTGGSTAMNSGLELAYKLAYLHHRRNAVNHVVVLSDGDANVGPTSHGSMLESIKWYADEGITLSTVGFGLGNYHDHRMEQLADKGNGNNFYIDSVEQAKRVFGKDLLGTTQVIAKDVKVQVEFDPGFVNGYRLVGYENRHVADEDFRNDKIDAGEIGLGHTVTALYEVELDAPGHDWATVRVRYKQPQGDEVQELATGFDRRSFRTSFASASNGYQRAIMAAALAENLRQSPYAENWTLERALDLGARHLETGVKEEAEILRLTRRAAQLLRARRGGEVVAYRRSIGRSEILSTVKVNLDDVKRCAAGHIRHGNGRRGEVIKMRWHVRPDGRATSVSVLTPRLQNSPAGVCMTRAIRGWRFPRHASAMAAPVTFPFVLNI